MRDAPRPVETISQFWTFLSLFTVKNTNITHLNENEIKFRSPISNTLLPFQNVQFNQKKTYKISKRTIKNRLFYTLVNLTNKYWVIFYVQQKNRKHSGKFSSHIQVLFKEKQTKLSEKVFFTRHSGKIFFTWKSFLQQKQKTITFLKDGKVFFT